MTFLGVGIILNSPSKLVFAFFVNLLVCIGHSLVFIGQTIVIYHTIYIYIFIYIYIYIQLLDKLPVFRICGQHLCIYFKNVY